MSNLKTVEEAARIMVSIAKEIVEDRGWNNCWVAGFREGNPYLNEDLNENNYGKAVFVKYEQGTIFTKENPLNEDEEKEELEGTEKLVEELNKLEGTEELFGFDVLAFSE